MKKICNTSTTGLLIAFLGLLMFSSCKDDFPEAMDTSSKETVLKSIKIMNAGEDGNTVLQGTVDEDKKEVSFPRLDTLTDFSKLRFEATLSDGAKLEQETYNISFEEGQSEKTIEIKVVNTPRFREYFVKLRLRVPVFGADFGKATVYDYSTNEQGNPAYEAFTGQLTRGTGFDGEHVLIISRGATGAHLLKVSDLKNNIITRIPINTTGVTGGTYTMNMGAQINGHTYIASLSGAAASPLKIYHWTDPAAAPEVIANINIGTIAGAGPRHGDNVSFNLDDEGNGYVYFISTDKPILRLKITNYNQVSDPYVINSATAYGQWSSYLQVGNADSYLLTGNTTPISVVNSSGSISYTMNATSIPKNASDARVVTFNGERYLLVITVARSAGESTVIQLYDITRGSNIVDALTIFEQGDKKPLYSYPLSSNTNTAPASQTGWAVVKDEDGKDKSLLIFGAATDAGFAIIEVPKKVLED
ncbi:DUF4623 domain-containing protein (plasmid) [Pedobacter sp. BS3]|uniref:DUF4623 domain-containing protein n=1 Tax=Pedobacter sp. BS3 TaxID=2567937 RepID=UPI0011ED8DD3|nr:DUF4623 domain-containing protein [Pedobacter sp. BS3]TZF85728.1 DUF4623 domain-containing protein [Pedobacter sp. BS3]